VGVRLDAWGFVGLGECWGDESWVGAWRLVGLGTVWGVWGCSGLVCRLMVRCEAWSGEGAGVVGMGWRGSNDPNRKGRNGKERRDAGWPVVLVRYGVVRAVGCWEGSTGCVLAGAEWMGVDESDVGR
jgi:hypothetical protein